MPEAESTQQQAVALSGPRRALYDALSKVSPVIATMYHGALLALDPAANPARHSQCAHSIRELMDKLPRQVNVPVKAQNERMGDKVKALHPFWKRAADGA